MKNFRAKITLFATVCLCLLPFNSGAQEDNQPPSGYSAIFNGEDLSGWYGLPQMDPRKLAAMSAEERAAMRDANQADVAQHWRVENGELVNDGHGVYLATDKDYGDFDLWIDYQTVPKADSGIYLRGNPQVQIWDYTEEGGKWNIGADKGSGGLWNNSPGSPGKDPVVLADHPFGQWNRFRIMQVGARTTVWLNGKKIVDHAIMENFNGFDRSKPHYHTGPIQLQTHGGEIRWRNIFIREISADDANRLLSSYDDLGFKTVFNGYDFSGWEGPTDNYEVNDGVVMCKPGKGGTIYTAEEYGDFVARLEFKLPPGGNNGLAIRYPGQGDTAYVGMTELQVLDTEHPKYGSLDPRQAHGSAYGMVPAHRGYLRPTGQWNFQEVTVVGSTIRVELNGNVILDTDLADVTEFMGGRPHPGVNRTRGHFGFAGHSDPVQFRNVRIKSLDQRHVAKLEKSELGTTRNVHQCGSVFLAGQPAPDDIDQLKQAGIDLVLDLRMQGEVEWDEPAVIEDAGLTYRRLPFRGPETLTDDIFENARRALKTARDRDETVLMHCGSANRVGAVWLAHRVLDDGVAWPEALMEAIEVGLRTPGYIEQVQNYISKASK